VDCGNEEPIVLVLVNHSRSFCGPPKVVSADRTGMSLLQIEKSFWWSMTTWHAQGVKRLLRTRLRRCPVSSAEAFQTTNNFEEVACIILDINRTASQASS